MQFNNLKKTVRIADVNSTDCSSKTKESGSAPETMEEIFTIKPF